MYICNIIFDVLCSSAKNNLEFCIISVTFLKYVVSICLYEMHATDGNPSLKKTYSSRRLIRVLSNVMDVLNCIATLISRSIVKIGE